MDGWMDGCPESAEGKCPQEAAAIFSTGSDLLALDASHPRPREEDCLGQWSRVDGVYSPAGAGEADGWLVGWLRS